VQRRANPVYLGMFESSYRKYAIPVTNCG